MSLNCMSLLEVPISCIVYLSIQEDSKVTKNDIVALDECCPDDHGCSFNLLVFVLSLVLYNVLLPKADIAFNILYLSGVDIYLCTIFHHHLCLLTVHLQMSMLPIITSNTWLFRNLFLAKNVNKSINTLKLQNCLQDNPGVSSF